jgi:hypothetical protein
MDDLGLNRTWPTLHRQRLANVRRLYAELKAEGVSSRGMATLFGVSLEHFERIVDGNVMIDDAMAREFEWATHRPRGWLDVAWAL